MLKIHKAFGNFSTRLAIRVVLIVAQYVLTITATSREVRVFFREDSFLLARIEAKDLLFGCGGISWPSAATGNPKNPRPPKWGFFFIFATLKFHSYDIIYH